MTFSDIFKSNFLANVTSVTLLDMLLALALSFGIGLFIFLIYKKTYAGVMYSSSFGVTLIGMTMISTFVILAVTSNVVLSLGMVGALSIVRYRTAVKDPTDLLYLFWAVASGIATGAGMFLIALFVFLVMAVILLVLSHARGRRDELYILLVHYTGDGIEEKIRRAIGTHPYKIKSKTLRQDDAELAVEVRVRRNDMRFVDALRADEAIRDLTLVQYSGDYID